MSDEILLNEREFSIWSALAIATRPLSVEALVEETGLDQSQVTATGTEAAQHGYIEIQEDELDELVASDEAKEYVEDGFPERRAIEHIIELGGKMPFPEFIEWANSTGVRVNEVFKWGGARNWITKEKDSAGQTVCTTPQAQEAHERQVIQDDEKALKILIHDGSGRISELEKEGIDPKNLRHLLGKRQRVVKFKNRIERKLKLSKKGEEAFKKARKVIEKTAITPEDIESGAWKNIKYRRYDVSLQADDVYPAKIHPLRKIINETRHAFLQMGFAEVISPMVESAFWNFDALFQPQDHPARDMQDTFYMAEPNRAPLPEPPAGGPDIVEQVARTHEDGWETGSEGWGYTFRRKVSEQVVLRTHTTAATIRALAAHPDPPGKFFCVGWTYRNETISFKHLPVFHQVDGIIIDEEANLASLLGTLQEFYSKMGFGKVKFKPAFYPYTEPSVDVVVYMESRRKWLEMGGAGIFRPEVTLPLGCKYPVLAWGLGIERLAMLRFGLNDIRDLYRSHLDGLEAIPLCR